MIRPDDPRTIRTAWWLLLLFGVLTPTLLWRWVSASHGVSDFQAFRSFGLFVAANPAAGIYVPAHLAPYQHVLHGLVLPYLYDPAMLLLVRPLAFLPAGAGRIVWSGAAVCAFAASLACARGRGRAAAMLALAALVAPSTLVTLAMGQNSLLMAGVLIAALRCRVVAPVVSGVLFGVATLKPQLGLLVPVLLLAGREWTTIAAAAATAAVLVAASVALFGAPVWHAWIAAEPTIASMLPHRIDPHLVNMPTATAMAIELGCGFRAACWLQGAATLAAAALVWRAGARARGDAAARAPLAAAVLAASLLATPYAYYYDLPLVTGAVLMLLADKAARGLDFAPFEAPLLIACLALPFFRMDGIDLPVAQPLIAALAWRASRLTRGPEPGRPVGATLPAALRRIGSGLATTGSPM